MALVIDQIEGTVVPESGHPPDDSGQGGGQKALQPFVTDLVEGEILRVDRRHARLRAD